MSQVLIGCLATQKKKRIKHQGQQEEVATHTASVRQLVSVVIRQ